MGNGEFYQFRNSSSSHRCEESIDELDFEEGEGGAGGSFKKKRDIGVEELD